MIEAHATARYVRTSAQKAGLVLDLIRGRGVNVALATLRFARKSVARDVEKVLRSAIANAQQKDGFSGDVDTLFVAACYAGQGPSMKRVRPAPMGRAFRVVKRTAHLTVRVAERSSEQAAEPVDAAAQAAQASPAAGAPRKATGRGARKAAPATKKGAAGKGGSRAKAGARKTGRNTGKKSR
jgi:large subunit ribosomal protein L22